MRKRNTKTSRTARTALRGPLRVEFTEQEILADLLYPARAARPRRPGR